MLHKIKEVLLILILGILHIKCSQVRSKLSQKSYLVNKYCNGVGICEQGTHIMCTHFNFKRAMGPHCMGTKNITMKLEYEVFILSVMNEIRSRVANDRAVGYNRLPRGYGIFRLEWDYELGMFAQLWANQCIRDYDLCHATSNHPDPGQLLGNTLFLEPQWNPKSSKKARFKDEGYSLKKVKYGVEAVLAKWYRSRDDIDADIILGLTRQWSEDVRKNPFIQIIQGSATHVGCGLSIFQDYEYDERRFIYNYVFLVCNFSSRVIEHHGVYTTEPPTEVGYTVKCGCPLGYDEDDDCLCYYSGRGLPYTCKYGQCKPHVVVLPIITVDDAPPHLLINVSEDEASKKLMSFKEDIYHNCNTDSRKSSSRSNNFTKSSMFLSPIIKKKVPQFSIMKKDVTPRKNFLDINNIVINYLNKTRDKNSDNNNLVQQNIKNNKNSSVYNNVNSNLNMKENIVHNDSSTTAYPIKRFVVKLKSKESDKILINLLKKLEDETKYIHLNDNEKTIIDKKIKNIYGTLVEKYHFHRSNSNSTINGKKKDEYNDKITTNKTMKHNNNSKDYIPLTNNEYNFINYNSPRKIIPLNNKKQIGDTRKTFYSLTQHPYAESDYMNNDDDDLISLDRKQYYQNKLNNLERLNYEIQNYYRDDASPQ